MDVKKILPVIGIVILIYIITTLDLEEIVAVFSGIHPVYSVLSFFLIVPISDSTKPWGDFLYFCTMAA